MRINKISYLMFTVALSTIITSCLKSKDSLGVVADTDATTVSGIFDRFYYGEEKVFALNASPSTETFNLFNLRYSSPRKASSGVKITIAVDNSIVTNYNTVHGTNFIPLPTAAYSLPDGLVHDLPGGAFDAEKAIKITLNKTALNLTSTYGIGVKITQVSEGVINANENNFLASIQIKNQFDGVYELTLYTAGWQDYGIGNQVQDIYPAPIEFLTTGANSVSINQRSPSTFGALQPGWTGPTGGCCTITGYTSFGATSPRYTFDLATNKALSVVNTTPDDGRGRQFVLDPASTTSGYNPATKEIYLEYFMKQNGRPDQTIRTRYRYLGPR